MEITGLPFESIEMLFRPCRRCGTPEKYPDPVDLARYRESWGVSLSELQRKAVKPNGKLPSLGYLWQVESPAHSARCPDWLLDWYRQIPHLDFRRERQDKGNPEPELREAVLKRLASPITLADLKADLPKMGHHTLLGVLFALKREGLATGEGIANVSVWRQQRAVQRGRRG